jgi:aconitate hydratase
LQEVRDLMEKQLGPEIYRQLYRDFAGQNPLWNEIPAASGSVYTWDPDSTYIQEPPFFDRFTMVPGPIAPLSGARALASLGIR